MDPDDLTLLAELEHGLPLVPHPYAVIGSRISMDEDEVIRRIAQMKKTRIIRRLRARINQRSIGIVANALVGWKITTPDPDSSGLLLASKPGVTHCYRRRVCPGTWEYTHYTVHHGWSRRQILTEVEMIAKDTGFSDYIVLFSTDEYKRTPHVKVQNLVADQ